MSCEVRLVGEDDLPSWFECLTIAFLDRPDTALPDTALIAEQITPYWDFDRVWGAFGVWGAFDGPAPGLIDLVHQTGVVHARPNSQVDGYGVPPRSTRALLINHIDQQPDRSRRPTPNPSNPPDPHGARRSSDRSLTLWALIPII